MEPRVSYLICATPRCGGYLLFEALENTGLAGKPGEYFWEDERWAKEWGATDYFLGLQITEYSLNILQKKEPMQKFLKKI